MLNKLTLNLLLILFLSSCTTGRLEYLTSQGERKFACETEYTWKPSVDKYAVEYILGYCAKQAKKQGNTIVNKRLLSLDLSIPKPPQGMEWNHQLAKERHGKGLLTDKEYGYLIAYLDLDHHQKISQTSN